MICISLVWLTHACKFQTIPQQNNGYDCGVFACMFAEAASRRGQFVFTQKDMPSLRKRMVYEILTKNLLS